MPLEIRVQVEALCTHGAVEAAIMFAIDVIAVVSSVSSLMQRI